MPPVFGLLWRQDREWKRMPWHLGRDLVIREDLITCVHMYMYVEKNPHLFRLNILIKKDKFINKN